MAPHAPRHIRAAPARFRRALVLGAAATVVALAAVALLGARNAPLSVAPPRLAPLLSHTAATYPAQPNDWKRPLVISLHATELNTSYVRLALFSTGVHTDTYGRTFLTVGCLVGSHPLPAVHVSPEMSVCHVPTALLFHDVPLTILLHFDSTLETALNSSQTINGETFTIHANDVTVLPPRISDKLPERVAAVRTAVRWRQHMLDRPTGARYELCMMTAMRQYPFLLGDWIDYYRRMGVDYFYIYENNAEVPLGPHVDLNYAEVVHWPWSRSQMQSNNHFLLVSSNRCKYVAYFDADEFVMVGDHRPAALKRYIKSRAKEGYKQIVFHFLMMINSGYVRRPKGSLPMLYTHREKNQKSKQGKVVVDMDKSWSWHRIHLIEGTSGTRLYWNETLELNPKSLKHNSMLVHYSKRSWEDYVAKNAVGGASVMTTGRPKLLLDVNKPDPAYMKAEGVVFNEFRQRYQQLMRSYGDDGRITLKVQNDELADKGYCVQHVCPKCWFHRVSKVQCSAP